MSGSSFAYVYAGGGSPGSSGYPQFNSEGLGGSTPIGAGGGAGSSQNGVNGVVGLSGRGGSGSLWLDGNYYAGGGGGPQSELYAASFGMDGGGNGLGYPGSNGVDGTGGGAGGEMPKGGSGIVILRYLTSSLVPPYDHALSGGSLSITGSYAYITFTGSSQLTYRF